MDEMLDDPIEVIDPESPENIAKRAGKTMELMQDIFSYDIMRKDASSDELKNKILNAIESEC